MTSSSDSQRAQIVAAAITEFALAGLAGARVDAIARRAGVNKRMLYHHVGDKQALFDVAVAECRASLLARLRADPEGRPRAEQWRVLCAAVAADRAPELAGADLPALTREAREALLGALALELLGGLWPELAAAIVGLDRSDPALGEQLEARLAELASRPPGPALAKQRVKLKPVLRRPI